MIQVGEGGEPFGSSSSGGSSACGEGDPLPLIANLRMDAIEMAPGRGDCIVGLFGGQVAPCLPLMIVAGFSGVDSAGATHGDVCGDGGVDFVAWSLVLAAIG